jgi:hypothetical protein
LRLALPRVEKARDTWEAANVVLTAVGAGEITLAQPTAALDLICGGQGRWGGDYFKHGMKIPVGLFT